MAINEQAKQRAIKQVIGYDESPTSVTLRAVAAAAIDAYHQALIFNPDCACKFTCGDVAEADDDPLARCKNLTD